MWADGAYRCDPESELIYTAEHVVDCGILILRDHLGVFRENVNGTLCDAAKLLSPCLEGFFNR